MELQVIEDFNGIIENPDNFPEEVVSAAIDSIRALSAQFREVKTRLEGNLIKRMEEDGATKLQFVNSDGVMRTATLSKGKMEASKEFEQIYRDAGFDPSEVGDSVFRPSWTRAKQALKFGGLKKEIIERCFKEKNKFIKLGD